MFSTLTSFLYPAMHQARISNIRTLGEKTSHIKLIFVKYIVNFFFIILDKSYEASFTWTVILVLINEIKSRMFFVYLLLVSSLIKPEWRTIPNCYFTVNICSVGIVQWNAFVEELKYFFQCVVIICQGLFIYIVFILFSYCLCFCYLKKTTIN